MGYIKSRKSRKEADNSYKNSDFHLKHPNKFDCESLIKTASIRQHDSVFKQNGARQVFDQNEIVYQKCSYLDNYSIENLKENYSKFEKNCLKSMDNKKNTKNDYLSWDISASSLKTNDEKKLDEIPKYLFKSYLTATKDVDSKNIPLKDVPMNELVKKLQQEFEQEEEKSGIDHIWNK